MSVHSEEIFSAEPSDEEGELVCIYCRQESDDFSILGENVAGELDGSIDSVSGEDARLNRHSLVCDRKNCIKKLNKEAASFQDRTESGHESDSSSDSASDYSAKDSSEVTSSDYVRLHRRRI